MLQSGDFSGFLLWEQTTRDAIDFKTIYVDMADDLIAGLLLSQIVYWHLPNHKGQCKLRVQKDGFYWIAKRRTDWYDEIRITAKQADRATKILEDKGIIITCLHRFDGAPTLHIRINHAGFMDAWHAVLAQREKSILPKGENTFSPKGEIDFTQRDNSLTETVTETVTEITSENDDQDILTDLIDLAHLAPQNARAIFDHYGPAGAAQWLAFVLNKRKRNPAAYLYACCIKKHDPAPVYAPADVQRILARFRKDPTPAATPPPSSPDPPVDTETTNIWTAALRELEGQMTRTTFATWIKPLSLLRLDRDTCEATLQAPNPYIAEWATQRLAAPISRTLAGIADLPADVFTITCVADVGEEEITF